LASASLLPSEQGALHRLAEEAQALLKAADALHENVTFEVLGHTDSTGPEVSNQNLSQRRAERVVQELSQLGVPERSLSPRGVGTSEPLRKEDSEANRQYNRCVNIHITSVTHWPRTMLKKKICMLGSFAVGKTSLVRRFVESIYSDVYQTTVGVKVDKKNVQVNGTDLTLVLWDIYGEDDYQKMHWTYLRGASGYLLVADGTRKATLDKAFSLEQRVKEEVGVIPFVFVLNK